MMNSANNSFYFSDFVPIQNQPAIQYPQGSHIQHPTYQQQPLQMTPNPDGIEQQQPKRLCRVITPTIHYEIRREKQLERKCITTNYSIPAHLPASFRQQVSEIVRYVKIITENQEVMQFKIDSLSSALAKLESEAMKIETRQSTSGGFNDAFQVYHDILESVVISLKKGINSGSKRIRIRDAEKLINTIIDILVRQYQLESGIALDLFPYQFESFEQLITTAEQILKKLKGYIMHKPKRTSSFIIQGRLNQSRLIPALPPPTGLPQFPVTASMQLQQSASSLNQTPIPIYSSTPARKISSLKKKRKSVEPEGAVPVDRQEQQRSLLRGARKCFSFQDPDTMQM